MTPHIVAQFSVPNLDDSGADAEELEQLAAALELLARYARNRAVAQRIRTTGHGARFLATTDKLLEELYNNLPQCWHW